MMMARQDMPHSQAVTPRTQGLNHIEVALDATPQAAQLINHLHRFVREGDASLDLVYALPPRHDALSRFETVQAEFDAEVVRLVNQQFDAYAQTLSEHHLPVNHRHFLPAQRQIEDALLSHVEASRPDLLVMGMTEHPLRRSGWMLDSTSYMLATHSPVSTLVLKRPPLKADGLKVLVATDGSSYAMNAIERLTTFLPVENVEISLLTVI